MILMVIFAVGLPLWLVCEEVLQLRARRTATQETTQTARSTRRVGVVLSRSNA